MKELFIIKIGGNVIDSEKNLSVFLKKFAEVKSPKVLIHGGGKLATDLSAKLGIEAKMVDGKRITDAATLEIVSMVYSGINKSIVAKLQAIGIDSIGICGADLNMIPAKKRAIGAIDYGFVGDVLMDKIPVTHWTDLIEKNICPIVAPITADASGQLLNTNADTIASSVAQALSKKYKVTLVYCFEKNGVLQNPDDEQSVISLIQPSAYATFKNQGVISKGMIAKLDNSFDAMKNGVDKVIIGNALQIDQLVNSKQGTHLSLT